MSGHLFIVRGDLTRLDCDGWLMPTSFQLQIERYWLQPEPPGFRSALRRLKASRPETWDSGELRVMKVPVWWDNGRSRPWLVNVMGCAQHEELETVVRSFIEAVMAEKPTPRNGRERLLLALPVISTGKGGGAKVKGAIVAALVRSLLQLVGDYAIDLVLVTHTAPALAAAQKARRKWGGGWPELSGKALKKARSIAELGRHQGLALFLGAGVSVSAGLPSWNDLLQRLAGDIGISATEQEEFRNLDVLDRGSILDRRFRAVGRDLRQAIAQLFSRTWDHSLLHSYLACLPSSEAITQNYDRLFEAAAEGSGRPAAVLPYTPGLPEQRWLLKMHGCVSRPDDIVIQREDYLRYTERRAALTGIVQALLLTRYMLFVGFSLRDGNFHRAVDDVRRALVGQARPHGLGTALFLGPSPLTAELWQSELDIVHFRQPGEPVDGPVAAPARRLEIFMDCLLAHCGSNTDHLLDPTFAHLLSRGEQELKDALTAMLAALPARSRQVEAWSKVEEMLRSLGWTDEAH